MFVTYHILHHTIGCRIGPSVANSQVAPGCNLSLHHIVSAKYCCNRSPGNGYQAVGMQSSCVSKNTIYFKTATNVLFGDCFIHVPVILLILTVIILSWLGIAAGCWWLRVSTMLLVSIVVIVTSLWRRCVIPLRILIDRSRRLMLIARWMTIVMAAKTNSR